MREQDKRLSANERLPSTRDDLASQTNMFDWPGLGLGFVLLC